MRSNNKNHICSFKELLKCTPYCPFYIIRCLLHLQIYNRNIHLRAAAMDVLSVPFRNAISKSPITTTYATTGQVFG